MNTDPFLRALPEATKLVAQEHLGRLATTWVKEKKDASSAVGKQAEAKARGSSTCKHWFSNLFWRTLLTL